MKLGIGLPNGGIDVDAAELVRLAVGAEQIGLDSIWVMDRWLRPHAPVSMPGVPVPITMPADSYRSVYDPIDVLAFLAAKTDRIQLGTSAINVLYHPPVLLARRLATLDQLCGGRLVAGVTSGWMAEEFAVAGVPTRRMGSGFDDHLAAMRAIWAPDPVRHDGPHYSIPTSDVGPKPQQDGGIPLIVGYTTEAGILRAALIGDGLHPYRNDFGQLAQDLHSWRAAAEDAGRDAATMPVVLRAAATLDEPNNSARTAFTGPVKRWADDLAAAEEMGVEHVLLQFDAETGADRALELMSLLARR